jgi:selenocysteine-specific elongation factor
LVSKLADETLTVLREAHRREPLATGITRETVREAVSARMSAELFKLVITRLEAARKIESDGVMLRLADHSTRLSPAEKRFAAALRECYAKAGLEPQKLADAVEAASAAASVSPETSQKLVQLLITRGELVRIDAQFCFDAGAIEGLKKRLLEYAESAPGRVIDVAGFKDLAGVSRKFAIPLLEYFDREKVTARAADKRVIL